MKFILDDATGKLHYVSNLSEQCNTDQIKRGNKKRLSLRQIIDGDLAGGVPHILFCKHCLSGKALKQE